MNEDKPTPSEQEEPPYALTDQHIAALERAIRAEGYEIMIDPVSGSIRLVKPGLDFPQ